MDECVRFGSPMGRRMDGESRREDDDAEVGRRGRVAAICRGQQQGQWAFRRDECQHGDKGKSVDEVGRDGKAGGCCGLSVGLGREVVRGPVCLESEV